VKPNDASVLNDQRVVNFFGFGLATAIAIYALVAMLALAPALLAVLGRTAWLLPGRRGRQAAGQAPAAASAPSPDRGGDALLAGEGKAPVR
jgi:RND superfamily putative drug exporter